MNATNDRVMKNGTITYLKLNAGDLVEYTSKAGKTSTYTVVKTFKDEIMYGPMRGSQYLMVELAGSYGKTFTVRRNAVKKV